jgi:adenylate cyclase
MEFRMGINVGDVVVEGEKLYGDGVNITARLEELAEPGGLCISGTVHDQVKTKLALGYGYLGEQAVKNIAEPVRVYRVQAEPEVAASAVQERGAAASPSPTAGKRRRVSTAYLIRAVLALVGLAVSGGGLAWYLESATPRPQGEHAASLPLTHKPSLAVLPFVNFSADPKQDYFSDGLTDTLITDLSKLSGLFVIARNSTFAYKGRAVKPQQVSLELGVRYLLEGSVQRDETRVRINAQLVDATTGHHLWAERYDRELKDLFALQDEIREKIVLALKVTLTPEEQARFRRAPTANLEAYDALLRGAAYLQRATREASSQAQQMFERAIALDPQYAVAYAALSTAQLLDLPLWDPFQTSLDQIFALAQRAVELDDSLAIPHSVLGAVYLWKKQHEQAMAEAQRAVSLDPNYAGGYDTLAEVLNFAGRPEEALGLMETAMRLDPAYPAHYLLTVGQAYLLTGRYEEAIAACKKALARNPHLFSAHELLALSYGELGREEEARAAVAALRKIPP